MQKLKGDKGRIMKREVEAGLTMGVVLAEGSLALKFRKCSGAADSESDTS